MPRNAAGPRRGHPGPRPRLVGDDRDIIPHWQKIVCLRHGDFDGILNLKEAVEQLKAIYPHEATRKNAMTQANLKLGELALQQALASRQ
jgi:hypothetical protein